VRWAKANALQFNGTDQVGGLGSSSGGHQVLLTALRPRDERYTRLSLSDHADVHVRLSFVVACWPIAHPLECYRRARDLNLDGVAAYDAYWRSEAAMREGDPHLIVERGEAEVLPPLLVLRGTADDVVPEEMQPRFVASCRAAGGQVELVRVEGMPHTFVQRQREHRESKRAIETMIRFVKAADTTLPPRLETSLPQPS
jgi:acetyl esterase/lipase